MPDDTPTEQTTPTMELVPFDTAGVVDVDQQPVDTLDMAPFGAAGVKPDDEQATVPSPVDELVAANNERITRILQLGQGQRLDPSIQLKIRLDTLVNILVPEATRPLYEFAYESEMAAFLDMLIDDITKPKLVLG